MTTTCTGTCPAHCPEAVPPEPPVGTWVRDRFGGVTMRQHGGGWAPPGFMPLASWRAMWERRGPLVECGPWGQEPTTTTPKIREV
jgi:hypothetical protein